MSPFPCGPLPVELAVRVDALVRRSQHLPPRASRPLTVSGRVAGWITARAARALVGLPGIRVDNEAVHLTAVPGRRLSINGVLATAADRLREAGCLRGWRNELLDVFGEGRHLGAMERAAMRPLGLLTQAVHLNAWSPDGRLWVARRAMTKSTDPGMWDTLVGGLVGSGESCELALERESAEEAGLAPGQITRRSPIRMVVRMHHRLPEGYQVENLLTSDCVLDEAVEPCNQDGEVSEIRCLALEEVSDMIRAGEFTLEAEWVILEGWGASALRCSPGFQG